MAKVVAPAFYGTGGGGGGGGGGGETADTLAAVISLSRAEGRKVG
jgi:hypothetical protein